MNTCSIRKEIRVLDSARTGFIMGTRIKPLELDGHTYRNEAQIEGRLVELQALLEEKEEHA